MKRWRVLRHPIGGGIYELTVTPDDRTFLFPPPWTRFLTHSDKPYTDAGTIKADSGLDALCEAIRLGYHKKDSLA